MRITSNKYLLRYVLNKTESSHKVQVLFKEMTNHDADARVLWPSESSQTICSGN